MYAILAGPWAVWNLASQGLSQGVPLCQLASDIFNVIVSVCCVTYGYEAPYSPMHMYLWGIGVSWVLMVVSFLVCCPFLIEM